MEVKDLMVKTVIIAEPDDRCTTAAQRMEAAKVGCLVVMDDDKVVGVITDRDLVVRCMAQGDDPNFCQVNRHMTSPAIVLPESMEILDASKYMVDNKVKRMPVMRGNELVGLVSFSDIAQAIGISRLWAPVYRMRAEAEEKSASRQAP